MPTYPEVEYSVQAWTDLLTRVAKGTEYMLAHPTDAEGYKALGLFIDLLDAAQCMGVAHMAAQVLNESATA